MCDVEFAEPWEVLTVSRRRAAREHRCSECLRLICVGEIYQLSKGKSSGEWLVFRACAHCLAAAEWLNIVCGGWVYGGVFSELVEHWSDGYRSVPFARLIVSMKRRWHDGADPVPVGVPEMAQDLMRASVA